MTSKMQNIKGKTNREAYNNNIMMLIDCKWVDTLWQWSFNMLHIPGLLTLII